MLFKFYFIFCPFLSYIFLVLSHHYAWLIVAIAWLLAALTNPISHVFCYCVKTPKNKKP